MSQENNDLQIKAYFYPSIVDAKGRKVSHLMLKTSNDVSYEVDMKEYADFFKVAMPNVPVELNCHYHDDISNTWTLFASLYVLEDRFIKH